MDESVRLQNISIGNECFSSCDIEHFNITGGKVTIGDLVFRANGKLTEIHVPVGTVFGDDVFRLCLKNPIIIYNKP